MSERLARVIEQDQLHQRQTALLVKQSGALEEDVRTDNAIVRSCRIDLNQWRSVFWCLEGQGRPRGPARNSAKVSSYG